MKIFYTDKVISFESKNNHYQSERLIFYNGDPDVLNINILVKKLEYTGELIVICDDVKTCFDTFAAQFEKIEAAGGVISNPRNEVLMIYRNDRWDLPKGKREPGEPLEYCAEREVREECGIEQVAVGAPLVQTYHFYQLKGVWSLKKTHWYTMTSSQEQFTPQQEEGITDVRWIPESELKNYTQKSYKTISEVIERFEQTRRS